MRSPTGSVRRALLLLVLAVGAGRAIDPGRVVAADEPSPPPPSPPSPDGPADADERAEAVERHAKKGWEAFLHGRHEEALLRMQRLEKADPENAMPGLVRARIALRTGKYEDALELATAGAAKRPDDRALEAVRFEALRRLGRAKEARELADAEIAARPDDLVARTVRGLVHEEAGRRGDALAEFDAVVAAYNGADPRPEEFAWVAQAAIHATRLSPDPKDDLLPGALKLLKRRIDAAPEDVDALLVYADLLQSRRGSDSQSSARKYYAQILLQNPEIVEARVGMARVAQVFGGDAQALQSCTRALQTDPRYVPALAILAASHVGDGDYEKADGVVARALAVNPTDRTIRSIAAAKRFIVGDRAGFEALEKEILRDDPTFASLYTITADLVGTRQRRFDVAAELSAKAVALDPTDDQAYVTQGVNLMNLGREDEAREAFAKAYVASKEYQDVVRDNFTEILQVLESFSTATSENFVLRQNVLEAGVMEPYLLPLLEEARTVLSEKYGFTPEGPVLVESFHRHDDFSARTLGVVNIPALGVCFGKVIVLDGPFARGLGEFSWARTAWHEYAHVVTLQMSKGQVPRWLTEGLSVHEEKARKPEWGRDMDRMLYDRWRNGKLLKMAEINGAFRTGDVMFAYFQGGLIADFVSERYGFEAVRKMLRLYADDVPTEKVFERVFGVSLAAFDATFDEYVKGLVGGYRLVPRWDDDSKDAFEARTKRDATDAEAWTRLAWAHFQRGNGVDAGAALAKAKALAPDAPEVVLLLAETAAKAGLDADAKASYEKFLAGGNDDFGARLALARLARTGTDGYRRAVEHLEAAHRCFPRAVGRASPLLALASLHQAAGEPDAVRTTLEAYARLAPEDFAIRQRLAQDYEKRGDDAALLRVSQEMVEIQPFGADRSDPPDLDLHRRYARVLEKVGRTADAEREWRVQGLLARATKEEGARRQAALEAHVARARLLLDLGRADEALDAAFAALALDPGNAEASALRDRALKAEAR